MQLRLTESYEKFINEGNIESTVTDEVADKLFTKFKMKVNDEEFENFKPSEISKNYEKTMRRDLAGVGFYSPGSSRLLLSFVGANIWKLRYDTSIARKIKGILESSVNEALDINDPIIIKLRAAQIERDRKEAEIQRQKEIHKNNKPILKKLERIEKNLAPLNAELEELMDEMEMDAGIKGEEWDDSYAAAYAKEIEKIEKKINKYEERKRELRSTLMENLVLEEFLELGQFGDVNDAIEELKIEFEDIIKYTKRNWKSLEDDYDGYSYKEVVKMMLNEVLDEVRNELFSVIKKY